MKQIFSIFIFIGLLSSEVSWAACPPTQPHCESDQTESNPVESGNKGSSRDLSLQPTRPPDMTEVISNSTWAFEGVNLFGYTLGQMSAHELNEVCVTNNSQSCAPLPMPWAEQCSREVRTGCRSAVGVACTTYISQKVTSPESCADVWSLLGASTGCSHYASSSCASSGPVVQPTIENDEDDSIDDPNLPGPTQPPAPTPPGPPGPTTADDDETNPNGTPTNLGNGRVPAGGVQQGAERLAQVCVESFADANKCCNDPMSCLGGPSAQFNAEPQGIQEACQMMMDAGQTASSMNAAGAYLCDSVKNGCLDTCQVSRDQLRQMIQAECGYDPTLGRGQCEGLQQAYDLTVGRQVSCSAFSANVQAMGQQAAHAQSSQQMAERCQQQSATQTASAAPTSVAPSSGGGEAPAGDINQPQASQSKTQEQTKRKTAGVQDSSATPDFGTRPSAGFGFDDPSLASQNQQPSFGEIPAQQRASANGVPNNGGGFTGASATGGSGYGSGGGSSAGKGGGGYNTDVLHGLGGGSGYSNPSGSPKGNSQGGFRLPSSIGIPKTAAKASGRFDLKRFLPGGSHDPRRRLAGSSSSQIGPSHGNIWVQLSNRVRELCRLKKLMDCGS